MSANVRERILDAVLSDWTINIGSGVIFYGGLAGAVLGWAAALIVGGLGGLGGAFYSTFK